MKTLTTLLMSLLLLVHAEAEVYKSVGPNGEVIYSDQPQQGAKPVTLPPVMTYTPAPPPPATPKVPMEAASDEDVMNYDSFSITAPAADETIHDNTGAVTVTLDLQPELDSAAGHRIVYMLDGEPMSGSYQTSGAVLTNIARGSHTLAAQVVDAKGKPLISTSALSFHMKRQSALQPPPGGKPRPQPRSLLERLFGIEPEPVAVVRNPGNRTDNPNLLSQNPNLLSDNPNQPGRGLVGATPAP
jgi:hypothetical protein